MDCNMWRIDFMLGMVDRPEEDEEAQQGASTEIKFYTVTDSNELPF